MEQKGQETRKLSLCPACAAQKGFSQDGQSFTFNLPAIMAAMSGTSETPAELSCPHCGLTSARFRQTGRVGCAWCYEHLRGLVAPVVARFQAGPAHRGLRPAGRAAGEPTTGRAAELREALRRAVAAEQYEEAARLRDELRGLEKPRP